MSRLVWAIDKDVEGRTNTQGINEASEEMVYIYND